MGKIFVYDIINVFHAYCEQRMFIVDEKENVSYEDLFLQLSGLIMHIATDYESLTVDSKVNVDDVLSELDHMIERDSFVIKDKKIQSESIKQIKQIIEDVIRKERIIYGVL